MNQQLLDIIFASYKEALTTAAKKWWEENEALYIEMMKSSEISATEVATIFARKVEITLHDTSTHLSRPWITAE